MVIKLEFCAVFNGERILVLNAMCRSEGPIAIHPGSPQEIGIVARDGLLIAGDDESLLRVEGMRHLFKGNLPLPVIFSLPAWYGQRAVSMSTQGNGSCKPITDVPCLVSIEDVEGRCFDMLEGSGKGLPIFCRVKKVPSFEGDRFF